MNLEQRFPFSATGSLLVALFRFRNRDAEALRELLDRIVERKFLVELEKLDDVAARAAAEAFEEALVSC